MLMSSTAREDEVIRRLKLWAMQRESVRAMLLTSTRANPNATLDAFSDYDIILIVDDIHPYYQDRSWLGDFGDVLVAYWDSIYLAPEYGLEVFGNVTQYVDGLKMDFTLWPIKLVRRIAEEDRLPANLDVGYTVLLDKGQLTAGLKAPTYTVYIPKRPTGEAFYKVVEDFYSDAPYVAKCLLRDELLPAKWCLDYDMKHVYLRQMLEWRMELDCEWSIPTGALGKGLKKRLPAAIWSALEETFAGAEIDENWEALFKTLALFRDLGKQVADGLGYLFPDELDRRVTAFLLEFRARRLEGIGCSPIGYPTIRG